MAWNNDCPEGLNGQSRGLGRNVIRPGRRVGTVVTNTASAMPGSNMHAMPVWHAKPYHGDVIEAENCWQHAEHYSRTMREMERENV